MARRSGLGKGLGALIPTEPPVTSSEGEILREVPLASVEPNRYQPRQEFDADDLSSLTASIRELGVLQPILVRPLDGSDDTFELIAGERRLRAAKRAGLVTIPVLVRADVSDQSSLEQALVENLQRADLNTVEEAEAYQRLIDEFGLTHDETAVRVGKSRAAVTNTLRLLQLPAGVKEAIKDGSISAGHGRALLGTPDRGLQEDICAVVVAKGLSVRSTEELVKNGGVEPEVLPPVGQDTDVPPAPGGKPGQPEKRRTGLKPLPAAGVVELEELLSTYLNTRVNVEMLTSKKGKVHVEFADIEDLERLYRLMLGNRNGS